MLKYPIFQCAFPNYTFYREQKNLCQYKLFLFSFIKYYDDTNFVSLRFNK